MPEHQIFEPDGRAIRYVDEGAGPAVVLIPASGVNLASLGTLAGALTEADHRIVRVDSRRPSDGTAPSLHDLAQDVVDVMDHLGIEHAWIGGHAFGGAVARTVALDHHDRVNGVLLLGVLTPDAAADAPADVPDHATDAEAVPMQRAALAATPADEWAPAAPGIPMLVIQGTTDAVTPESGGAALQASAPDRVSLVPVDGGGHLFPLTHAGATAWAIEDYLDWD